MRNEMKTGLRGAQVTEAVMRWVQTVLKDYPYEDLRAKHLSQFDNDMVLSRLVETANLHGVFRLCRELCCAVGLPDPKVFDHNPASMRFRLRFFHDENPSFIIVDLARADDGTVAADYYCCEDTPPQ